MRGDCVKTRLFGWTYNSSGWICCLFCFSIDNWKKHRGKKMIHHSCNPAVYSVWPDIKNQTHQNNTLLFIIISPMYMYWCIDECEKIIFSELYLQPCTIWITKTKTEPKISQYHLLELSRCRSASITMKNSGCFPSFGGIQAWKVDMFPWTNGASNSLVEVAGLSLASVTLRKNTANGLHFEEYRASSWQMNLLKLLPCRVENSGSIYRERRKNGDRKSASGSHSGCEWPQKMTCSRCSAMLCRQWHLYQPNAVLILCHICCRKSLLMLR